MTIIRWLGQACFLLLTLSKTPVLIDPPAPQVGYRIAARSIPAQVVFVSHSHLDHSFVQAAAGKPFVVRPWTQSDSYSNGHFRLGPAGDAVDQFTFRRIFAYHDNVQGKLRGPDTITVIGTGGLRIVHLGDLGQYALTPEQVKEIGRVDVLMIPVGGFFTIDGKQAIPIIDQLKPRVIIPMHYGTASLNPELRSKLAPVAAFVNAMKGKAAIVHVRARDLKLSPENLPATPTVYLLRYE